MVRELVRLKRELVRFEGEGEVVRFEGEGEIVLGEVV